MSTLPTDGSGLGEQNSAYRKGFVLGLTMAETAILIIFVLLLLLIHVNRKGLDIARQFQNSVAVSTQRLAELKGRERVLLEASAALGLDSAAIQDDFIELMRLAQVAAGSKDAESLLRNGKAELSRLKDAREQLTAVAAEVNEKGGAALVNSVEQQSFRIANQEGQIKRLENQVVAAGGRRGERACWADRFGKNEYLYDVVLTSRGIRMREYRYTHRARERALLPAPEVDPKRTLSPEEFYVLTRPLFLHSLRMNCRYFVVIYDATAAHEKPLYKDLLRTVEGHFYKYLSNDPAPF